MNWIHILLYGVVGLVLAVALVRRLAERRAENPFATLERFKRMREDFERKG